MQGTPISQTHADITRLLLEHRAGDREALDRVIPVLYDQLCMIAQRQLRRVQPGDSMDTSGLVTETYLRLMDESSVAWESRGHFIAICARTMRRILVDSARHRHSLKRDVGALANIDIEEIACDAQHDKVLAVDQALEALSQINPRMAKVVECRFFAGMTEEEASLALNVPLRTVQRDWLQARAWLQHQLH